MGTREEDHNRGQEDGSKAGLWDQFIAGNNPFESEHYNQGFVNGVNNPSSSEDSGEGSEGDSSEGGSNSGSSGCFITSACVLTLGLADNCVELLTLRRFRDSYVLGLNGGQAEIHEYYAIAPRITAAIAKQSDPARTYQRIYKGLVSPCVLLIQQGSFEEAYRLYKTWVAQLTHEFIPA